MDKDLLLHISNCFCTHCCGLNKKMDCDHTNRTCQQLYNFLIDCKNYKSELTDNFKVGDEQPQSKENPEG